MDETVTETKGFIAPTSIFPLVFSHPSLEGLEVWMSRPSVDAIGDMMMMGNFTAQTMTKEDVATLLRVFEAFIGSLKKWNVQSHVLDGNGIPTDKVLDVPPTPEGVRSLDGNFLLLIILGWVETVTGVSWKTEKIGAIPMETQK